jgi:dTMP kinase
MAKKFYFIGSISAGDKDYKPYRQAIGEAMRQHGEILDEHVLADDPVAYENTLQEKNICKRDYDWVDEADAGVADISVHTTGGGAEIERLRAQGKPVLILHKQGTRGSWLHRDMAKTYANVSYGVYEDEQDAERMVDEWAENLPERTPPGKFIVFEGLDLCGKGTQLKKALSYIWSHPLDDLEKQINVSITREPYKNTKIRSTLRGMKRVDQDAELLANLFIGDRQVHLHEIVEPNLLIGQTVLSDRYQYSTIAYQGILQGLGLDEMIERHAHMRIPDLVLMIDIDWKTRNSRAPLRGKAKERFDRLNEEQFGRQRAGYRQIAAHMPKHNIKIIDGSGTPEEVFERIEPYLLETVFGKTLEEYRSWTAEQFGYSE